MGSDACNVCGADFGDDIDHPRWQAECRAIYTIRRQWYQLRVSGISRFSGLFHRRISLVKDYEQRYDEPGGLDPSSFFRETAYLDALLQGGLSPLVHSVDQVDQTQVSGFAFHASCWRLLEAACRPGEVNVRVLNDFCRSIPRPYRRLPDWDSDYGGAVQRWPDRESLMPGEDSDVVDFKGNAWGVSQVQERVDWSIDPATVPGLKKLLQRSIKKKEDFTKTLTMAYADLGGSVRPEERSDTFSSIPGEILLFILTWLPSRDVASLRLASRTFSSVDLRQEFWASRFGEESELSTIYEALEPVDKGKYRDWRSLYKDCKIEMRPTNGASGNRARVWTIVRYFQRLLNAYSNAPIEGSPAYTIFDPNFPEDTGRWAQAGGSVSNDHCSSSQGGYRTLYARTVDLMEPLSEVFVSMVQLFDVQYVSGIRFVQVDRKEVRLGYIMGGEQELPLRLDTKSPGAKVWRLREFRMAVSSRGIHALAVVTNSDQMSTWAGSPQQHLKVRLPSGTDFVTACKGRFDGVKMLKLGIPEEGPAPDNPFQRRVGPLQDIAKWYPDIPADYMDVNEEQFKQKND